MHVILTPMNSLILRYQGILLKKVKEPYSNFVPLVNDETNDYHLLWMLQELLENTEQSETKKHRWLGFIQGIIIMKGYTSVSEERDSTRDILNGL